MSSISPPPTSPPQDLEAPWSRLIPEDQWIVFITGAESLRRAGIPFLLGGALALATYTLRWRSTKDVDVLVRPADAAGAVAALQAAGFSDYHATEPYDRSWIFRGIRDGVLFDIIWELPNHRVEIDEAWFERAPWLTLKGIRYQAIPAEELIRIKLYVMQRERCDWVDVLNVLAGTAERLDWPYLMARMGRDRELLHAVLAVFNWMCPARARALPPRVRREFALPENTDPRADEVEVRRVNLFDSRPWFALHQPENQPLER